MNTSGFVTSREAARRLGLSPTTLRQVIRREAVDVFRDPLDSRRKLLRVQDLETLRQPRSVPQRATPLRTN